MTTASLGAAVVDGRSGSGGSDQDSRWPLAVGGREAAGVGEAEVQR